MKVGGELHTHLHSCISDRTTSDTFDSVNPRVAVLDSLLPIASGDRVVAVLGCG